MHPPPQPSTADDVMQQGVASNLSHLLHASAQCVPMHARVHTHRHRQPSSLADNTPDPTHWLCQAQTHLATHTAHTLTSLSRSLSPPLAPTQRELARGGGRPSPGYPGETCTRRAHGATLGGSHRPPIAHLSPTYLHVTSACSTYGCRVDLQPMYACLTNQHKSMHH